MASLLQGTIVWATMLDPQGKNPKCRPGIVLNYRHQHGEDVIVTALTTSFCEPLGRFLVEIPCDARTLLKRRCVAVCNWLVLIVESDIASVGGRIDSSLMRKIIASLPKPPNPT